MAVVVGGAVGVAVSAVRNIWALAGDAVAGSVFDVKSWEVEEPATLKHVWCCFALADLLLPAVLALAAQEPQGRRV